MSDIQFPNVLFGPGSVTATVQDNNGAPASVLEAASPFTVHVDWSISALAALLLGGQWELAVYVESIGPGPEQQVGPTIIRPLTGATSYTADVVVPGGTLPDDPAAPNSGVYKVATVLTHRNFGSITDVVGVVEGPLLRIG